VPCSTQLRLPAFQFNASEPYSWPMQTTPFVAPETDQSAGKRGLPFAPARRSQHRWRHCGLYSHRPFLFLNFAVAESSPPNCHLCSTLTPQAQIVCENRARRFPRVSRKIGPRSLCFTIENPAGFVGAPLNADLLLDRYDPATLSRPSGCRRGSNPTLSASQVEVSAELLLISFVPTIQNPSSRRAGQQSHLRSTAPDRPGSCS
jgi:hypothetical protein